jgi:hypothetical protein
MGLTVIRGRDFPYHSICKPDNWRMGLSCELAPGGLALPNADRWNRRGHNRAASVDLNCSSGAIQWIGFLLCHTQGNIARIKEQYG